MTNVRTPGPEAESARPHGRSTPGLVFICGFASGGTDLLKNVMNAHPAISLPGEFPFLPKLADEFEGEVAGDEVPRLVERLHELDVYGNFPSTHARLPASANGHYALAEVYAALAAPRGVSWTGNKTPSNTQNIDRLRALFPRAKFIVIVRDVRDVALSWDRKWGKHKLLCAAKWDRRMRQGRALARRLPEEDVLVVRYEDLLRDLEAVTRDICRFLELEHVHQMLDFHRHVPDIVPGKINYGRPIVPANREKWRRALSAREVRRIEEIAYRGLTEFGYEPSLATRARPITRFEVVRGRTRDAFATLFVGNRALEGGRLRARVRTLRFELRKLLMRRSVR
jgi:Sulfotransferase family